MTSFSSFLQFLFFCITVQEVSHGQLCPDDTYNPTDWEYYSTLPEIVSFDLSVLSDIDDNCNENNERAWLLGLSDGNKVSGVDEIDYDYFQCKESFVSQGYLPLDYYTGKVVDNRGVTIGSGVDLGQTNRSTLSVAGVDSSVLDKLDPYFGLINTQAAQKLCQTGGFNLTVDEAQDLTLKYIDAVVLPAISDKYNNDRGENTDPWSDLRQCYRTVILDFYVANGNQTFSIDFSGFWTYTTSNDWEALVSGLASWDDDDPNQERYYHSSNILQACGDCSSSIDLAFLVDASRSVSAAQFTQTLQFVSDLVSQLATGTQIGISQFSSTYRTEFTMSTYDISTDSGRSNAISDILGINKLSTLTALASAISQFAPAQFGSSSGVRDQSELVPRVAMIMTDGKSQDEPSTTVHYLTDLGVTVITVGIGNYDVDQLTSISDDIFFLENFDDLTTILDNVAVISCDASATLDVDTTFSDIVEATNNEVARYRIDISSLLSRRRLQDGNSLAVKVNQTDGCVYVYVSYCNEYANKFSYDYAHQACEVSMKEIIVPFYDLNESCTVTELFVNVEGIEFGVNSYTIAVEELTSTTEIGVNYIFDTDIGNKTIGNDTYILNANKECVVKTDALTNDTDSCSTKTSESSCLGHFGYCEWIDFVTNPPSVNPTFLPTINPTFLPSTPPTPNPTSQPISEEQKSNSISTVDFIIGIVAAVVGLAIVLIGALALFRYYKKTQVGEEGAVDIQLADEELR